MSANRKRGALIASAVLVVGVFAWLLYGGIGKNIVYFLTPGELLAKGSAAVDQTVRLGGQVVPNSVTWDAQRLDLRFKVTDGIKTLDVHSVGALPQMFRPGIGVLVEGRYARNGVFEATQLMVKHSNEYHPPAAGHDPREVYKTLMKEGRS